MPNANEKKAYEIAQSHRHKSEERRITYWNGLYNGAIEMAEWKNEQFKNLVNNVLKSFVNNEGGRLIPEQEAAFKLFAERLTTLVEKNEVNN